MKRTVVVTVGALSVSACLVPESRYDEAVAKLHAEEGARRTAEQEIAATRFQLGQLDAVLKQREENLQSWQGELAESKVDVQRVSTERDDAVALVEQLRGELGRVGDNLKEFSDRKQELEAALTEAEARAKRVEALEQATDEMVLAARDVSIALRDAMAKGQADVSATGGKLVVRFDARRAFPSAGGALSADFTAWFERLGSALCLHEDMRLRLEDRSGADVAAAERAARLDLIRDILAKKGISPDRMVASDTANGSKPVDATETASSDADPAGSSYTEGPGSIELTVGMKPSS